VSHARTPKHKHPAFIKKKKKKKKKKKYGLETGGQNLFK
jgi:hypothetical protein